MAEEKKANYVPAEAVTAVKKDDTKLGFFQKIGKWFREMKSELKKVVWPSKKTTTKNVLVAVTVMVVSGIVIWAFDQIAMLIVQTLMKIGG